MKLIREKITIGQVVAEDKINKLREDIRSMTEKNNYLIGLLLNFQNLSQDEIIETVEQIKEEVSKKAAEMLEVTDSFGVCLEEANGLIETYYELSSTDALTWLLNKAAFDVDMDIFIKEGYAFNCISIDMNDLKKFNDINKNHEIWNDALKMLASSMIYLFWNGDSRFYRVWWDEFIILNFEEYSVALWKILDLKEYLEKRDFKIVRENEITHKTTEEYTTIHFAAWITPRRSEDTAKTICARADELMYEDKEKTKWKWNVR